MEEKPIKETPVKETRTWSEEIELASHELVDFVKRMIAEGNVRRLIISRESGEKLIEVPLTTGVVVGGALTLFAPVLAALGALAALVASVKVEIIRIIDSE